MKMQVINPFVFFFPHTGTDKITVARTVALNQVLHVVASYW